MLAHLRFSRYVIIVVRPTGENKLIPLYLLQVLYRNGHAADPNMNWVACLRAMRTELNQMGYDQIPELSSSRMIDVNKPMHIVPPNSHGRRRAILIGINYTGQQGQLVRQERKCLVGFFFSHKQHTLVQSGCHNDVGNIQKYLVEVQGFNESEMLILMDDNRHHPPTRRNIEDAFARMCQYSQAGDVVFVHYSGHGSRVRDHSGDEDDGYDSTLIPVDFKHAGQILDDDGTCSCFV